LEMEESCELFALAVLDPPNPSILDYRCEPQVPSSTGIFFFFFFYYFSFLADVSKFIFYFFEQ
jgi:hypothetical protein